MTKFVAYAPRDTSDLPELQLLRASVKGRLPADGDTKGFEINKNGIQISAEGARLEFTDGAPRSGTVKKISVSFHDVDQYRIYGLDIDIPKDARGEFSGSKNYEKNFIFHGDDSIFGSSGSDTLIGFSGKDWINGNGGDDFLSGVRGKDRLFGGGGADKLYGGAANDLLDGGKDVNISIGGPGKDRFRFSADLDSDNFTSIQDFRPIDRIELVAEAFAGIGRHGKLGADRFLHTNEYGGEAHVIVYDRPTGTLSYAIAPDELIAFGSVRDKLDLGHGDIFIV